MHQSIHGWKGEGRRWSWSRDRDATNRMMSRFYEGETVEAYFDWSVDGWPSTADPWRSTRTTTASSRPRPGGTIQGTTQFGRAVAELEIELIWLEAPSQGACGTVPRNHQDRWVKLLRLAGVTTTEANALVDHKLWRTTIAVHRPPPVPMTLIARWVRGTMWPPS